MGVPTTAKCNGCGAARPVDTTPCAVCGATSKTVYASVHAEVKVTATASGVAHGWRDVTVKPIALVGRGLKRLSPFVRIIAAVELRRRALGDEIAAQVAAEGAGQGLDSAGERVLKRSKRRRYVEVGRVEPSSPEPPVADEPG